MGNLLVAAAPGNRKTAYTYDALDRVTKVVDPVGRITNTTYDAMGRLAQITQAPNTATPAVTEVEAGLHLQQQRQAREPRRRGPASPRSPPSRPAA